MSYIVQSMTIGWQCQSVGTYTHDEIEQHVDAAAHAYIAQAKDEAPAYVRRELGNVEIVRIEAETPKVATNFINPHEHLIGVRMKVFYKVPTEA